MVFFLHKRMQISKAEAHLISLNCVKKRTGMGFPVKEIKYGNKAYMTPIFTHHIYTQQLLSQ